MSPGITLEMPVHMFGINSFNLTSRFSSILLYFSPALLFLFFYLPFTFWLVFCIHPFSERGADGCGDDVKCVPWTRLYVEILWAVKQLHIFLYI